MSIRRISPNAAAEDTIYLRSLSLTTTIAPGDVWSRAGKPTPVTLSVELRLPLYALVAPAGSDDLAETISYGVLAKQLTGAIEEQQQFETLRHFAEFVRANAMGLVSRSFSDAKVDVEAVLQEGLLLAQGVGVVLREDAGEEAVLFVDELRVACVVGVNPHERLQKQWVVVNLTLWEIPQEVWTTYPAVVKKVVDVSHTRFGLKGAALMMLRPWRLPSTLPSRRLRRRLQRCCACSVGLERSRWRSRNRAR
jgi:dihydroneopterin aldolase